MTKKRVPLIIALLTSFFLYSQKGFARDFYIKHYQTPGHMEFSGYVKANEFDGYYIFLQKNQSVYMRISDKRFIIAIIDATGIEVTEPFVSNGKNQLYFSVPYSGVYRIVVMGTQDDALLQSCYSCYELNILFLR